MKPWLVLVLLLAVFLLQGCTPSHQTIEEVNYFEGSDGLVMEFLPGSPPEGVYPGQAYPVTMRVSNKGSFSLLDSLEHDDLFASITLAYDPFYFEDVSQGQLGALGNKYREDARAYLEEARSWDDGAGGTSAAFSIEGKSVYWPEGETRTLTLGVLEAKDPGPSRVGADTRVLASLCFPYETKLTTPVCVDSDPSDNDDPSKVCHAEDLSFSDQGAPVAVSAVGVEILPVGTRVQTEMVREAVLGGEDEGKFREVPRDVLVTVVRPAFRIELRDVGQGQVVRGRERGEQKLCLKDSWDDLPSGSVVLSAMLGSVELDCSPDPVVLRDGRAETVCMLPADRDLVLTTNYHDFLQVYVDYVYQVRESVEVFIDDTATRYVPAKTSLSCQDFDGDYASCRAYGEGCYFCESSDRCVSGAECADCPDGTFLDEFARRCSTDCRPPSVSAEVDVDAGEARLRCVDNPAVDANGRELCGCRAFAFTFVRDEGACPPVQSYDRSVGGEREGSVLRSSVVLPEEAGNGEVWRLCVVGRTGSADGAGGVGRTVFSEPASVSFVNPVDSLLPLDGTA